MTSSVGSRATATLAFGEIAAGLRWTTATVILVRLVTTGRGLLMARLIGPNAFGLVAGVLVVTSLLSIVSELGLGSYLVYRGDRSRIEARVVAPYALASGLLGAGLVAASGGLIAEFYQEPNDRLVALAMSASVLLATLSALPMGVLKSELRFRELGLIQAAAELSALAVMVPLALAGAGVWALVAGYLTTAGFTLGGSWLVSEIGRPRLEGDWRAAWRSAFRYGTRVAGGGAFWAVALQADNAIVGHLLGATALGLYAVAYTYGALPGVMLGNLVNQVAFPVFSLSALDRNQLQEHFMRFVRISSITVLPLTALSIALSGVAVQWVLGSRWQAAIVPLQLFLVMGAWRGLLPTSEIFRSLGRVNVELMMGIAGAPAIVVSALVGSARGISLVALMVTAVFVASGLTAALIACHSIAISPTILLSAMVPSVALSLAVGLVAHVLMTHVIVHPAVSLTLAVTSSFVLYIAGLYLLPGGREIRQTALSR